MTLGEGFNWWADLISAAGLLVSLAGAGWAAKAVILTEDDALNIGLPRWPYEDREKNLTLPHVKSLLDASKGARVGLWVLAFGTMLQFLPAVCRVIAPFL